MNWSGGEEAEGREKKNGSKFFSVQMQMSTCVNGMRDLFLELPEDDGLSRTKEF